jgi:hypothetical protein
LGGNTFSSLERSLDMLNDTNPLDSNTAAQLSQSQIRRPAPTHLPPLLASSSGAPTKQHGSFDFGKILGEKADESSGQLNDMCECERIVQTRQRAAMNRTRKQRRRQPSQPPSRPQRIIHCSQRCW